MKAIMLIIVFSFSAILLTSCNNNSQMNSGKTSKEVWAVVKAHNKVWICVCSPFIIT